MKWKTKTARDLTMFLAGLGGFGHEVAARGERPTLLLACLALMGVPFLLRKDESEGDQQMLRPPEQPPRRPDAPTSPQLEQYRQQLRQKRPSSQSRKPKS